MRGRTTVTARSLRWLRSRSGRALCWRSVPHGSGAGFEDGNREKSKKPQTGYSREQCAIRLALRRLWRRGLTFRDAMPVCAYAAATAPSAVAIYAAAMAGGRADIPAAASTLGTGKSVPALFAARHYLRRQHRRQSRTNMQKRNFVCLRLGGILQEGAN
ncbi:MAG: hypothetical protein UY96_C0038G0003 [Parcubacteria group bacterium GW2011_GWB1_56_8]|nr:MAG: hypothetical protein UY96_C0038G0003 [Parcubacteria group bacterium GW2011_GWB1_56_8]